MGCIKMTVKELKEKLECLIEEGIGDYKIFVDVYYPNYDSYEMDESDILIIHKDKEVWI